MKLGPTILPGNWEELNLPSGYVKMMGVPVAAFMRIDGQLKVIMSEEPHNGTKWLHVSLSNDKRFPTWEEIKFVKNLFIGKDKCAVQIFPEEEFYVNVHPNCFHLWHRLDGETCPGSPQKS